MQSIWGQLEMQLQHSIPDVGKHFRSGALESTIQWVEEWLPVALPEEVKAFYRIHDGQSEDSCIVDGWSFFSFICKYKTDKGVKKMQPELSPVPRVFTLTQEWKRRFALIPLLYSPWSLIAVGLVVLTCWTRFGPLIAVLLGMGLYVVYLLLSYFLIYLITKTIRHSITPEGITFCSLMYCIFTPWSNIKRVGRSQLGMYHPQALLLEQPAVKGKVRKRNQLGKATIERRRWLTNEKYAPDDALPLLFTVPANWQESDLGLAIKLYAPQIGDRNEQ